MKKKILSILLTVTMLVSMLSFFSLSAGALQEYQYVSPGDSITFPGYTYYYEVILTGFTRGEWEEIPLYIPHNGHVLVQSYGHSGAYAPAMKLKSGSEVICERNNGFKTQGYNRNQTLFQFQGSGSYTLCIRPSTSDDMRLSFTIADYYFESAPPIESYGDIEEMDFGNLSGMFYYDTYAMVKTCAPEVTGIYPVTTSGFSGMHAFIIDPSSTSCYEGYEIIGEVTNLNVYLSASVTYYVVLFIPITPEGPFDGEEIECAFLSLTIGSVL